MFWTIVFAILFATVILPIIIQLLGYKFTWLVIGSISSALLLILMLWYAVEANNQVILRVFGLLVIGFIIAAIIGIKDFYQKRSKS